MPVLRLPIFALLLVPALLVASVRTDERTAATARNSYNFRTIIGSTGSVTVHALNGVVRLTGAVADEESRRLAEETADNLPGVDRVENELVVANPAADNSDAWIAARVRSGLLMQASVSAATVLVSVKDGAVTLSGTSRSVEQRSLTEHYVRRLQLGAVSSELRIVPASDPAHDELIDDVSILTQVKSTLRPLGVGPLEGAAIRVREGMVMISGPIASEDGKAEVTRVVREVRGVRSVVNTLRVRR